MMHQAAQQDAVEAVIRKRQMFDVAFQKLDAGIFGATKRDELRAEVEPDGIDSPAGASRSVNTPEPQPRSAIARAGLQPASRTQVSISRRLLSGVKTS